MALSALTDRRAWRRIAFLVIALPLGTMYFTVLTTVLSCGLGVAILTLGLPVLVLMWLLRLFAGWERRLAGRLLELELPARYRPRADGGWWTRLLARMADPATWKDLAYLIVDFPLGIADFTVVVTLVGGTLGLASLPAWYWAVPDGAQLGLVTVDTLPEAAIAAVIGVVLLPVAVRAASAFAGVHAAVARALLTSAPDPELSARVSELQSAQARLVAAADAERRRLERDLHDGAQQRLVAVALQIRMASAKARRHEDVGPLLEGAADEVRLALAELRDLARGIHPAVLTERGLDAALRDLAMRAPVPVEVTETPDERFPAPVEATIYFVTSEALANVAKYSRATHATIAARREDDTVVVEIADDGVGGADADAGSGLRGLRDRLGALDGRLRVESPPGAGTLVRAVVPAAAEHPEPAAAPAAGVVVLDDAAGALVQARRRRSLATHASVFGVIELALVVIWFVTGHGYFWPGWAIFGWGVALALHAALIQARPPLTAATARARTAPAVPRGPRGAA